MVITNLNCIKFYKMMQLSKRAINAGSIDNSCMKKGVPEVPELTKNPVRGRSLTEVYPNYILWWIGRLASLDYPLSGRIWLVKGVAA